MAAKQFTLETRDCYNYGIWVVDIIKDNGIELPQSTACDLLNKLTEENEELNSIKKFADRNGICIFNIDEAFRRCWQDNAKLVKENEELKKENNKLICIIKQLEAKYEDKGFSLAYDMGECE